VCANIESIQNVLTALFVASMGLIMSPVFLWHHAGVLLCGTLVVTLLKAAVVTLVVRMFDVPMKLSLAVGLSMAHIGEFSFVLLSMANQLKLLSSQVRLARAIGQYRLGSAAAVGVCALSANRCDVMHLKLNHIQVAGMPSQQAR
jgi:predicted Kef-type K+ transport protein